MALPSVRAVEVKSNLSGFPKPGEIIEMVGAHQLEAPDRAIFNLLYQHAHDSGNILDPAAKWEVPVAQIKQALSKHEGSDRLWASLNRLQSVKVQICKTEINGNGAKITSRESMVLLDFFKITANEFKNKTTLAYRLPRDLTPIIETSGKWGRIKAEIVCSMTSKYGIALYELTQLRANLERKEEKFSVERLRELLGVDPDVHKRADNLVRKVVEPAIWQVNGLSDMSVKVEILRRNARARVSGFKLKWWRKSVEEFQAAMAERNRSKVGRMARLKANAQKSLTSTANAL
jgi:hypothetical protein